MHTFVWGYFKASLPFSRFFSGDMETDVETARDILVSSLLCVGMASPFLIPLIVEQQACHIHFVSVGSR